MMAKISMAGSSISMSRRLCASEVNAATPTATTTQKAYQSIDVKAEKIAPAFPGPKRVMRMLFHWAQSMA